MLNLTVIQGRVASLKSEIDQKTGEPITVFDLVHVDLKGSATNFPVVFFHPNSERFKRIIALGSEIIVTGHIRLKQFGTFRDTTIIGSTAEGVGNK